MVADDRSGPLSGLSSTPPSAARSERDTQSATFEVGSLTLELSAAPGAARLAVSADGARDIYSVDPGVLTAWAASTAKLLSLSAAGSVAEHVEFRAPFLVDREGRASIAFEGIVTEQGVSYRLLITGAGDRVGALITTADVLREVTEAAAGAGSVARPSA